MTFPMSRRWTAYVAPKPQFGYCGNSDSPDGAALCTCGICYKNAHHNYVSDFTPAFRLSVCHTRGPRLNGLISKCLLHVRCTLAVHSSGPTCFHLLRCSIRLWVDVRGHSTCLTLAWKLCKLVVTVVNYVFIVCWLSHTVTRSVTLINLKCLPEVIQGHTENQEENF